MDYSKFWKKNNLSRIQGLFKIRIKKSALELSAIEMEFSPIAKRSSLSETLMSDIVKI